MKGRDDLDPGPLLALFENHRTAPTRRSNCCDDGALFACPNTERLSGLSKPGAATLASKKLAASEGKFIASNFASKGLGLASANPFGSSAVVLI